MFQIKKNAPRLEWKTLLFTIKKATFRVEKLNGKLWKCVLFTVKNATIEHEKTSNSKGGKIGRKIPFQRGIFQLRVENAHKFEQFKFIGLVTFHIR